MKSVTSATPSAVSHRVCRMSVSPAYRLLAVTVELILRRDPPAAVILVAEQGREAGLGIEARQAQPVHRTVRADQCGRLHVPDDGVIFDPACHFSSWLGGPAATVLGTR
jgi:hypothetical protein